MTKEELRIGNLLFEEYGGIYEVEGITACGNVEMKKGGMTATGLYSIDRLTPIPLTEEWLFKFGFEKKSWFTQGIVIECFYYQLNKFIVYLLPNSFEVEIINKSGDQFNLYKNWKHVHELQNIYFIFENDELPTTNL